MVQHTLKNRRSTRLINERLKMADKQVLFEAAQADLLLEAMDEQDLQKASAIIDKLRKIKGKGVKSLDKAIETAEAQLNKYTAGGPLTKAWSKLKSVVGFDNPLVKFLTFADALEQGFRLLPTIIKNNVNADLLKDNQNTSLAQLVTDEAKEKTLVDNMLKALSPKGFFGAFKKVPYVDKQVLVQDLMNVPFRVFSSVIQQINTGPNTQQVAADIKDVAMQGGDVATKGTAGAEPAQPTSGPEGTTPAKSTTKTSPAAATGETPTRTAKPDVLVNNIYQKFAPAFEDIQGNNSEKRTKAMLKFLADQGMLRDE